jgi:hypothetical protein
MNGLSPHYYDTLHGASQMDAQVKKTQREQSCDSKGRGICVLFQPV